MNVDLRNLNLDHLSLEPLETAKPSATQPTGRATFITDARGRSDRRKGGDRRQTVRLSPDRRSGKDRRPATGWSDGKLD